MRSCSTVLKGVAIVGFLFAIVTPLTACTIDEEAQGGRSAGANANRNPGSGDDGGIGTPGANGGADGGAPESPGSTTDAVFKPHGGPGCGLLQAAFCDTFDQPAGIGNRSGDLSPAWG